MAAERVAPSMEVRAMAMRNGIVGLLLTASAAMAQTDDQVALPMGSSFYSNNTTYTDGSVHAWQTATPASQNMNAATLASRASTREAE